jgi:ankyrin repeat protein
MAKWLLSIENNEIDISVREDFPFCICCQNNHIEMAKWLLDIKGNHIDISNSHDWSFRICCNNGHIKIAKWLLSIENNHINISALNDSAFHIACEKGHHDIIMLLININNKYSYLKQGTTYTPIIRKYDSVIDSSINCTNECSICYINIGYNKTNCNHYYCSTCIDKINIKCPLCCSKITTVYRHH